MRKVVLISCASKKLKTSAQAKDLYTKPALSAQPRLREHTQIGRHIHTIRKIRSRAASTRNRAI